MFKKKFPNLANEMEKKTMRIKLGSVRSEEKGEDGRQLSGYIPDAVDFIRRCNIVEEANEIIDFLEKHGEISSDYATKLRTQLRVKGLRSFGSKKGQDYYFKKGKD